MRKITLNLDALSVESFETAASARGEGTVRGHVGTQACGPKTDAEQTYCCPTYAPYICASADDGCPTVQHGPSVCYCNTDDYCPSWDLNC